MKVGDYVRTRNLGGSIEKILEIIPKEETPDLKARYTTDISKLYSLLITEEDVIKSSPNIIDLIEVGDYVNGEYVTYINKKDNYVDVGYDDAILRLKDIKSIVTKEQFESMEYKVGE